MLVLVSRSPRPQNGVDRDPEHSPREGQAPCMSSMSDCLSASRPRAGVARPSPQPATTVGPPPNARPPPPRRPRWPPSRRGPTMGWGERGGNDGRRRRPPGLPSRHNSGLSFLVVPPPTAHPAQKIRLQLSDSVVRNILPARLLPLPRHGRVLLLNLGRRRRIDRQADTSAGAALACGRPARHRVVQQLC